MMGSLLCFLMYLQGGRCPTIIIYEDFLLNLGAAKEWGHPNWPSQTAEWSGLELSMTPETQQSYTDVFRLSHRESERDQKSRVVSIDIRHFWVQSIPHAPDPS